MTREPIETPGLLARQLALRPGAPRWLRRLFVAPVTAARDGTITTRTPTGHTDDSPVPIPLGRPVAPGTRDHTRRHLQRLATHADTPAERTAADLIYRGLFDYAA